MNNKAIHKQADATLLKITLNDRNIIQCAYMNVCARATRVTSKETQKCVTHNR